MEEVLTVAEEYPPGGLSLDVEVRLSRMALTSGGMGTW